MAAKKNSTGYWERRIASRTWEIYNSAEEKNRKLIEMYKDASTAVTNELYRLAEKLQKQGFTRTDTWRKNQLVKLNKEFLREIKKLGGDVESFSNESMYDAFRENYENITEMLGGVDVVLPNKKAMEKMMRDPWRGSDFSSRLWENTKKLSSVLNDTLRHGIQQGKNITEIAVELDAKMQQGFNVAHRLVRTETMHTLNTSSLEGYKASGVEKVQFWAAEDERTCDLCGKLHGKVYSFDKAPVLPLHPNCRCTYLPVLKDISIEKTGNAADFNRQSLVKSMTNGIIKSDKQLGKKIGKHAKDYGLDPSNDADRQQMIHMIDNIINSPDEVLHGEWRSQPGMSDYYIKGEDVVVVNSGRFVTILKGGISNERIKNAGKSKI